MEARLGIYPPVLRWIPEHIWKGMAHLMKPINRRGDRIRIAVASSILALLCLGGAAFAVSQGGTDNPVPVSEDAGLAVDKSPSAEEVRKIGRFSMLEEPTQESLAELSKTERDLIVYGLKQTDGKQPGALSSVGRVQTTLGSSVLVFTSSAKICFYSTKSSGQNLGTCVPMDSTISHGAYVTGENFGSGDFYLLGLVPDDVEAVDTGREKASDIQLYGNIYEAVVGPEDLNVVGRSESGEAVIKQSIPIGMYAGK